MKHMTEKLKVLIDNGFNDERSILKQEEIETLEAKLYELNLDSKKGYTIPQIDTVGMNLIGKLSYNFKGY